MYYYITKKSGTAKSGKWYGFLYVLGVNRWREPEVRKLWIDTVENFDTCEFDIGSPLSCTFDADGHLVSVAQIDGEIISFPAGLADNFI